MRTKPYLLALAMVGILAGAGHVHAADSYDYAATCPQNGSKYLVDKWNFYQCQCTSYVADKLNEYGVKFNNAYKGVRWSNASNWVKAAATAKVPYNTTPKRHDVAWFSNHVAFVESVDSKGNVTISEYNIVPFDYSTRTLKKGSSSYPKYFIHFGAK